MNPDRLLECVLTRGVEFVIIGGVASVLHGSTLPTRDLDLCIPLVIVDEGIMKFMEPFKALLAALETKRSTLLTPQG